MEVIGTLHVTRNKIVKRVVIRIYVDDDQLVNKLNSQTHTGILIYVRNASIIWFSKRQNTVESSTFGLGLITLNITMEMVDALR